MATLRELRDGKYLSVRELAALAGVALSTLHLVETGRQRPHPRTARKIAAALGVEPGAIDEFNATIGQKSSAKEGVE